ncbi:glycoside hydrolase family 43 protein [Sphingobium aromaticiconvertens]|uniref:glycoside hydrolase family 43 protein n=1 Tax=Sphingobium aromaticiconvertens TaxID=365341 RepID=UPI00301B19A6
MIGRRSVLGGLATLGLSGCVTRTARRDGEVLLFAYFATGKGEADGLRLAVSEDGFAFRPLAQGRSLLVPQVGEKKLMRDPFLFRGEGRNAPWHMVWTTAWEGVTIGHASSTDLIHWSPQQAIPVMASVPGTRNCWAPEAIYDVAMGRYQIFWSSTVEGRFPETAASSESDYNHRLWRTTTRDFRTFDPPNLLYDPGFSVIDGSFARGPDGSLYLIVKDETLKPLRKTLHVAKAEGPGGPFGPLSPALTEPWVEGPMTVNVKGRTICYYDVYREGRWGAMATSDFGTWEDVSGRLSMPAGARHGSLLWVSRATVDAIEAARSA